MDKNLVKCVAALIRQDIDTNYVFSMVIDRPMGKYLQGFHTFADDKPCSGAFLISDGTNSYWILLIDWYNDGNHYVVVYPERHRNPPLAELHQVERHSDGLDLKWSYQPTKRDGQNEHRRRLFKAQFGSLEVTVSLPGEHATIDDFLFDIFVLADCRRRADALDESSLRLTRTTFTEGKRLERKHKSRERSPTLVASAKQSYAHKHQGQLPREVCDFDFHVVYGKRGALFLEAHHRIPLSELDENQQTATKISDLALVCANCHRMLHRSPWVSVEELREIVREHA